MVTALFGTASGTSSPQFTTIFVPLPPCFHTIHRAETAQKIRRTNESSLHSAEFEEVTTRFELVNEGFADLCLTTWPRHHMSRNCFLLFFWSGRRGSNSLPPPWQGGALPDELRPHDVCSLRRTYKKMVPPIGIEPMTRGFSVPCSTD